MRRGLRKLRYTEIQKLDQLILLVSSGTKIQTRSSTFKFCAHDHCAMLPLVCVCVCVRTHACDHISRNRQKFSNSPVCLHTWSTPQLIFPPMVLNLLIVKLLTVLCNEDGHLHTHTYTNWDTKDSVGFSGEEYQMANIETVELK